VTEIVLRQFHPDSATMECLDADTSDDDDDDNDADVENDVKENVPFENAGDENVVANLLGDVAYVPDEMEVIVHALKLRERLMRDACWSVRDLSVVRELYVTTENTQLCNEQVFAEHECYLAPVLQRTSILDIATSRPILWWERRACLQTASVYADTVYREPAESHNRSFCGTSDIINIAESNEQKSDTYVPLSIAVPGSLPPVTNCSTESSTSTVSDIAVDRDEASLRNNTGTKTGGATASRSDKDTDVDGDSDDGDMKRAPLARIADPTNQLCCPVDPQVLSTDKSFHTFVTEPTCLGAAAKCHVSYEIQMPIYNTRKIMWSADGSRAFDVTLANGTVRVNHNRLSSGSEALRPDATNESAHSYWKRHNITVPPHFDYQRREHLVAFALHDAGPRNPTQYYCPQLYDNSEDRCATRYVCEPTEDSLQTTIVDGSHEPRCLSSDRVLEEDRYLQVRYAYRNATVTNMLRDLVWTDSESVADFGGDAKIEIRQGADTLARNVFVDESTHTMSAHRTTWSGDSRQSNVRGDV
jgi:hypothetical protein